MRTIDEILKRDDYARLTESLAGRVKNIAKRIRKKMDELDITNDPDYDDGEISVDGVCVRVNKVTTRGCGSYEFLAIERSDYHETYASLEDIGDSYYCAGDFNAWVEGATNKEALRFLNVAAKLIKLLEEIETKQVEEVSKALEATENV